MMPGHLQGSFRFSQPRPGSPAISGRREELWRPAATAMVCMRANRVEVSKAALHPIEPQRLLKAGNRHLGYRGEFLCLSADRPGRRSPAHNESPRPPLPTKTKGAQTLGCAKRPPRAISAEIERRSASARPILGSAFIALTAPVVM